MCYELVAFLWGICYAPCSSLFRILRLRVSSDASPAYRDLTCSYDADTSVALDTGDLPAIDFDNDTDVRCRGVVRLSESAPAVDDYVARPWGDSAVLLPDAERLEDLDVSRNTALSSDQVYASSLDGSC